MRDLGGARPWLMAAAIGVGALAISLPIDAVAVDEPQHVIVWREAGRYGGWPANHGLWAWGDEILVGFSGGYMAPGTVGAGGPQRHPIDRTRPEQHLLARSTDGGANWSRLASQAVTDAYAMGVGAPKPGSNYPALFIAGTANNTTGFFRSDDQGQTWLRINDDDHQFGHILVIQGDPRVYGRLYVGANDRGILVGDRK